ncbi:hypothetical protein [Lentisalinibacter salinarum]|uniref:hypothetical protein n=1 Tax=Lentisalinibacter salinarum TaxID=2992239 RepID=UPI00386F326C
MSNSDRESDAMRDRNPVSGPKSISRRSILKGSVKAMPVVLTLHSGAALARSSNLISGTVTPHVDELNRTACLDTTSVDPAGSPDLYDMGEPPHARVHMINERNYYKSDDASSPISEAQMCETGGTYYYKDQGWQSVNMPKGMLVSGTALTSFAGAVNYVDL